MDASVLIERLARQGEVFCALFRALPAAQTGVRVDPAKWCALEILCHLYDEEREDFRARLRHILETPGEPMPKIDPQGWVRERRYMEQDFEAMFAGFLAERARSVAWLREPKGRSWENVYHHPKVGAMSTELLLTNWVAHDLHHQRQLLYLNYAELKTASKVPLDYAGTW